MVYAMADTKSGPISPKTPVKEKIVGIYDDFFKVSNYDMMELDELSLRSLKLKMKKIDVTDHLEMFLPFHNPGLYGKLKLLLLIWSSKFLSLVFPFHNWIIVLETICSHHTFSKLTE